LRPEAPAAAPEVGAVLHALGDPTRRSIVERLSERPHSISGLAEPLGVTVTAIGQHLQILEAAGLATTEKVGRVRLCRLRQTGLEVLSEWIFERRSLWEQRLDRLGDLLGEA
jgi:DNA-binding transcriptional ArsR family regulator